MRRPDDEARSRREWSAPRKVFGVETGADHDAIEEHLDQQERALGVAAKWNYLFSSPTISSSSIPANDPPGGFQVAPFKPLPGYKVTPYAFPEVVMKANSTMVSQAPEQDEEAGSIHVAILDLGRETHDGDALGGPAIGPDDEPGREYNLQNVVGHGWPCCLRGRSCPASGRASHREDHLPEYHPRRRSDDWRRRPCRPRRPVLRGNGHQRGDPPDIVNMSFGGYTSNDRPPTVLAEFLRRLGAAFPSTVFVAAAGNDGSGRPFFPAACPGVVGVAATDRRGFPMFWSNHGSFIDAVHGR